MDELRVSSEDDGNDIGQLSFDERNVGAPAPGLGGPGYVYVISNPSMPDLLKIGLTARPVEDRMYDLQSTGVPTPFVKEFALHVEDARAVEQSVHERLGDCRVSANREFFRCSIDVARTNVIGAADGIITNADVLPEFAAYYEAQREEMMIRHRLELDALLQSVRRWKMFSYVLLAPAALFALAVISILNSA